jgi:hypothetical protein
MTKPSRFRKKPVVIEAIQFDGTITRAREIADWAKDYGPTFAVSQDDDDFDAEDGWWMTIETLEGSMSVQAGDWVIKGVQDEFYPCKDSIFKETYEKVVDELDSEFYAG